MAYTMHIMGVLLYHSNSVISLLMCFCVCMCVCDLTVHSIWVYMKLCLCLRHCYQVDYMANSMYRECNYYV